MCFTQNSSFFMSQGRGNTGAIRCACRKDSDVGTGDGEQPGMQGDRSERMMRCAGGSEAAKATREEQIG